MKVDLKNTAFTARVWVDSHAEAEEGLAYLFDNYFGKGRYDAEYMDIKINDTDKFGTYEASMTAWGKA